MKDVVTQFSPHPSHTERDDQSAPWKTQTIKEEARKAKEEKKETKRKRSKDESPAEPMGGHFPPKEHFLIPAPCLTAVPLPPKSETSYQDDSLRTHTGKTLNRWQRRALRATNPSESEQEGACGWDFKKSVPIHSSISPPAALPEQSRAKPSTTPGLAPAERCASRSTAPLPGTSRRGINPTYRHRTRLGAGVLHRIPGSASACVHLSRY